MNKWLLGVLVLLLTACHSVVEPTRELSFKLDDGTVQKFGFTKQGALPVGNGVYKVEQLGLMLYQHPRTHRVEYAWDVMVNVKEQAASSIKVSQLLNDGQLETLLWDNDLQQESAHPDAWRRLNNGAKVNWFAARWHGISAGKEAARASWMKNTQSEAMFVFKIDIEDTMGNRHTLYQPMVVSQESKTQYQARIQDALVKENGRKKIRTR